MLYEEFDRFEADRCGWESVYQKLNEKESIAAMTFSQDAAESNGDKNRYTNVLPFDEHRVKLKNNECDYINASLLKVPAANREYIITQGPLEDTCSDFWLMVWQQKSKGIIMLNKLKENRRIKCHQYYPVIHSTHTGRLSTDIYDDVMGGAKLFADADLLVSLESVDKPHSSYIRRTLLLTHTKDKSTRTVYHFQFLDWPDFGAPEYTTQFLSFLKYIRDSGVLVRGEYCGPPVVHCSAGIGRSGTLCLVDSSLKMMELNDNKCGDINVRKLLLNMRKYRFGLIQTSGQLRFAYRSIIDQLSSSQPRPSNSLTAQPSKITLVYPPGRNPPFSASSAALLLGKRGLESDSESESSKKRQRVSTDSSSSDSLKNLRLPSPDKIS